jgi:hypothetical protein
MAMPPAHGSPEDADIDVLDFGNYSERRWRTRRFGPIALLMAVLIGLVGGYVEGHHRHPSDAPQLPSARPVAARPGDGVVATGNSCSAQLDTRLELGVEVINPSSVSVLLDQLTLVRPRHGLRPVATAIGTCGQVTDSPAFGQARLRSGRSTWLTMTFDVVVHCPSALPVELRLRYSHGSHPTSSLLAEFPNLSRVAFSRCPPVRRLLPER